MERETAVAILCLALGAILVTFLARRVARAAPALTQADLLTKPVSVNYHFTRVCNYECRFCFHTEKVNPLYGPTPHASEADAKIVLRKLADAGMRKLNFSGGEPFLYHRLLGELCRFAKVDLKLESVSIVSNGSRIKQQWLEEFGRPYVDMIALSIDSANSDTLEEIGRRERGGRGTSYHLPQAKQVAAWIREAGIELRVNTTVTAKSVDEDMNDLIDALQPKRWKVFQMLLVSGENWGPDQVNGRDASDLALSRDEFQRFLDRHARQPNLIAEDNDTMRNSYLLLDEGLRFLNCEQGNKVPGPCLLDHNVTVAGAIAHSGFDAASFQHRSGVYDWSKRGSGAKKCAGVLDW